MKNQFKNTWKDKEVEAFWDKVADIYDSENMKVSDTHNQRFSKAVEYLQLKKGLHILNVTSRDCAAVDYLEATCPGIRVTNAEISGRFVELSRRKRPHVIQKKLISYSSLPFKSETFDRILTLETLEHVSEPVVFLSELYRVSVKNAVMVLSCPPASSELPYRVYSLLFGGHGEGPHRFLGSRDVKYLLYQAGWKLKKHRGTLLIPVGPQAVKKWGEKIIKMFPGSVISELGIRQFYVCSK